MKNNKLKFWLVLVVLIAIFITSLPVYAESVYLSASKKSLSVGQTVTISVQASGVPNLSSLGFDLVYDPEIFSYVSGSVNGKSDGGSALIEKAESNVVQVQVDQYIINSSKDPKLATLNFKAIKTTSKAVNFEIRDYAMADLGLSNTFYQGKAVKISTSVTVTEPPVLSKNADLKSLTIAPGPLTPAFRSDNNSYSVTVGETTKSLTVDAQAADPKAQKVDISGHTNLKPGLNTVRIVVTAESGATKTYTIKVTRTEAAPTPAATPTPAPSPTPVPSPTPAPTVQINGTTLTIAPLVEGTSPPAGFSEASINYEGQTLPAYVSQSGGITLVHFANSAGTTAYYVYDAATGSFAPYRSITIPARSYVLLPADDLTAPAGYKAATVTISGQTVNGFQAEQADTANGQATLVYLMSDSGTKHLYAWNEKTGELNRFVPPVPEGNSPTPAPSGEPTGAVAGPVGNDNDPGNPGASGNAGNGMFGLILVIVGLAALSMMLGGILLYQRFGGRRRKGYGRIQAPPIRRVDETFN